MQKGKLSQKSATLHGINDSSVAMSRGKGEHEENISTLCLYSDQNKEVLSIYLNEDLSLWVCVTPLQRRLQGLGVMRNTGSMT